MNPKQLRILIFILMLINITPVWSQFQMLPLSRKASTNSSSRILARNDTLSLPFWDDFSQVTVDPDTNYWSYGDVLHISNHIGIKAPTTNVATFDGSDGFGNPYNSSSFSQQTDSLISKPINLAAVSLINRSTVYFSFWWQMEGRGETPDPDDYIELQFFDSDGVWNTVWERKGVEANLHPDFTLWQESIESLGSNYFHEGFRFRFRSFGNTKGPFDVWHIDYVYLAEGRSAQGTDWLPDVAISSAPTSFFKDFTAIPKDQFDVYPDSIFQPMQYDAFGFRDQEPNFIYRWIGTDTISNTQAWNFAGGGPVIPVLDHRTYFSDLLTMADFNGVAGLDSMIIESLLYLDETDDDDLFNGQSFLDNDTVRTYYEIHESLAYDDGTAEFAAGIRGNEGEIAIRYNVAGSDTLTHVDIYFPQIEQGSVGSPFFIKVYNDENNQPGTLLRRDEFQIMSAGIDQFTRYELTRPIILSGEFHLAFQQGGVETLPLGLDNNNLMGDRVLVNTSGMDGDWQSNELVEGATMIRPIFARNKFILTSVDLETQPIRLYPNPADQFIHLVGYFDTYQIYSLSGQLMLAGSENKVAVDELSNGFYLIQLKKDNQIISKKFIINR